MILFKFTYNACVCACVSVGVGVCASEYVYTILKSRFKLILSKCVISDEPLYRRRSTS